LKHIPGVRIRKADGLSRRLDLKIKIKNNQKFIKEEWIRGMMEVVVKGLKIVLVEKIRRVRGKNKEVVKIVKEIKKVMVKALRDDEWKIEEDLVLKEGKVYVPKDKELRLKVIQLYHDVLVTGHVL